MTDADQPGRHLTPPAPSGWYPDPWHRSAQRYWDGERWTAQVNAPSAAPAIATITTVKPSRARMSVLLLGGTIAVTVIVAAAFLSSPSQPAPAPVVAAASPASDPASTTPLPTSTSPKPSTTQTTAAVTTTTGTAISALPVTTTPQAPPPAPSAVKFTPGPPAPDGFQGPFQVFTASGLGPATTPGFALDGTQVSGSFYGGNGTTFDLVGADNRPVTVATCPSANCSGGWNAPMAGAGTYRIIVHADPDTAWSIDLTETLEPPISVELNPPTNGTAPIVAIAYGHGDEQSQPFTIGYRQITGGEYQHGRAGATFWLVPAGRAFSTTMNPIASCTNPCASGSFFMPPNSFTPGTYYLVVHADGEWHFEIDGVGPPEAPRT